jgi:hypothetical protein
MNPPSADSIVPEFQSLAVGDRILDGSRGGMLLPC